MLSLLLLLFLLLVYSGYVTPATVSVILFLVADVCNFVCTIMVKQWQPSHWIVTLFALSRENSDSCHMHYHGKTVAAVTLNCNSVCTITGKQWQLSHWIVTLFLQVGRLYQALILLSLALCLPSASVSLVFMVLYRYWNFFDYILLFTF